ncbi:hypothetical protein C1645_812348 [Glomus cerebriforme]|uniref:DUF659 domain-containing protein n=1 Tax=Glomus cerebriforme TaxID=658196 RepID=A0A397TKB1_9GLOM|nr:hypothetical protein C1645_812348 [Glomus cerebriforme]
MAFGTCLGTERPCLGTLGERKGLAWELLDDENKLEIHITQKSMESFIDKDDPEVNKLFKMLCPSYNLPSRKWISTDVLDKVHEEINNKIEKFVTDHQSQIWKIENFSNVCHARKIMFEAYKKVEIEFETNKWIGFNLEIGEKVLTVSCIAHQMNLLVKKIIKSSTFEPVIKTLLTTFSKAAKTILSLRDNIRVMAITHSNLLITNRRSVINAIENIKFWERLMMFYELLKPYNYIIMILESEQATLGQVAAT